MKLPVAASIILLSSADAASTNKMGTKILVTTEGRSGSTLVGQLFNLHEGVSYFYEPCRSLPVFKAMKPHEKATATMMQQCTKLVRAILDCSFSASEMTTLLSDRTAVSKSAVLSRAAGNISASGAGFEEEQHAALARACHGSIRVVKEIRFTRGVPDNLLYSEVKVLHLVRDPRAVLHSRLQLEAFCARTPRACVQPLCQGYRATLSSIDVSLWLS